MNVYALEDHKIKVVTLDAGYEYHRQVAIAHLKVGRIYTVEKTHVHSSSTQVYIKEVPNVPFNTVFFQDVIDQSIEDDKKHPDYQLYH